MPVEIKNGIGVRAIFKYFFANGFICSARLFNDEK
ncbi:hypothetical protein JMT78AECX_JMT78AEC_04713 [Escherichia coli]|nr:hypothetical protein JMT78AECX_JMT78AEC_04713 [Escherichia coli]